MHQYLFTHLCLRVHIPAETINCQNADQEDQADVPVHRVPFEPFGFEVNTGITSWVSTFFRIKVEKDEDLWEG